MQPKVWIIVLNWNGYTDTCDCLRSLGKLSYSQVQLVIVDNASSDGSWEQMAAWAQGNHYGVLSLDRVAAESSSGRPVPDEDTIVMIQSGGNLGFAGGNNVGLRYALRMGADYVWLLNNDTVVEQGSLEPLVQAVRNDPWVGFAGSLVLYHDRPGTVQSAGMRIGAHRLTIAHIGRHESMAKFGRSAPFTVDCVPGCSVLINARAIEETGLMDEGFFMYHEDVDWQVRALKLGWTVRCVPQSRIWHKCGRSAGKAPMASAYYQARNKFLLVRKHAGRLAPLLMVCLAAAALRNAIRAVLTNNWPAARGIWIAAHDFAHGRFGMRASWPTK